jgi:hypothetical protein
VLDLELKVGEQLDPERRDDIPHPLEPLDEPGSEGVIAAGGVAPGQDQDRRSGHGRAAT